MSVKDSTLSPGSIGRLLKDSANAWMEDNALRLGAAMAYYSIFSIAPLLVICIAIAAWVFGQSAANGFLDEQLRGLVGPQASQSVQSMIQSASKPSSSIIAGIVGAITLLVGASGVFGQLKDALNTIWKVKPKSGQGVAKFIRERVASFGMVLVIGFLLLISLFVTTAISAMTKSFGSMLPLSEAVVTALSSLVSFGVITVLFAMIFKFLPDVNVKWRDVWIGAIGTGLLFEAGKFLLGLYLGKESTASPYGAAASVVLLLLWVYYASLILFFGAEFTQVHAKARGAQIQPSANAERVTAESRAEEGLKPKPTTIPSTSPNRYPAPAKESLAMSFHLPVVEDEAGCHLQQPEESTDSMMGQLITALGVGVAGGLVINRFGTRPTLTPVEQIKDGSKTLLMLGGTAAAAYLSRFLARTKDFIQSGEVQKAGKKIAGKVQETVSEAASKVTEAADKF